MMQKLPRCNKKHLGRDKGWSRKRSHPFFCASGVLLLPDGSFCGGCGIFGISSRPVEGERYVHRPRLLKMHRLCHRNASPPRIKNVPPPPRKLQIILQGSPEHLECILYMGCDLTDRDARVCGNLGISLAIETAGDEYVSGLLRHASDTFPEKILHFCGKNPLRIETLQ